MSPLPESSCARCGRTLSSSTGTRAIFCAVCRPRRRRRSTRAAHYRALRAIGAQR
jgi:DNA-directed RNA polymerase subunit RPC12/RpoP